MTSFAAQEYLRAHGRCPKGFTASSSGRCEARSAWEDKPAFGRVRGRGKGSRRGKRRAGLIEMVRANADLLKQEAIEESEEERVHGQSPSELHNAPWETIQADMLNKPEAEAVDVKFKEALESAGELCKKIVLNLVEYRNSKPTPKWDQLAETKYVLDQLATVLTFLLDKIENGNIPVPNKDPVTVG